MSRALVGIIAGLTASSLVQGRQIDWTGTVGQPLPFGLQYWETSDGSATQPQAGDQLLIANGGSVNWLPPVQSNLLVLGNGSSSGQSLYLVSGQISVGGSATGGTWGGLSLIAGGIFNQSGGAITTGEIDLASGAAASVTGGSATVTDGAITLTSGAKFFQSQTAAISTGQLILNAGAEYDLAGGSLSAASMQISPQSFFNWTGGSLNMNSAVTIGPAGTLGNGSVSNTKAYMLQQIGLTDAAHTPTNASPTNTMFSMDGSGQIVGTAPRYTGATNTGQDCWQFNPLTGMSRIGLTDAAHTATGNVAYNQLDAMNSAGQVTGTAARYSGSTSLGQDAWVFSRPTASASGTTTVIGLTDSAHTQTGGYSYNQPQLFNNAGQIAGYAYRYNGSNGQGQDVWAYTPAMGANPAGTSRIGLTDSVHTSSAGTIYNQAVAMNSGGEVTGTAERFTGTTNNGSDVWVFNPSTGVSSLIGLADSAHIQTGGYTCQQAAAINDNGQVAGTAYRYNGSAGTGQDAWVYTPYNSSCTMIGLTDTPHTETGGYSFNTVSLLSAAGHVAGTAQRFNGSSGEGNDAWIYTPFTNATTVIGLTDAAHVQAGGYANVTPSLINASGQVVGTAQRFNSSGGPIGFDAWSYSPTTGSSLIGLTDAAHTQTGGFESNAVQFINASGMVAGAANRYVGSSIQGQDAWVYDPATGLTYQIGSSQASSGYAFSSIKYLGDDGTAVGYYNHYTSATLYMQDAFVWTESAGLRDAGQLIQSGLPAGGWASLISSISAGGTGALAVNGTSVGTTGKQAFVLTPASPVNITAGMALNTVSQLTVQPGGALTLAGGSISASNVVIQAGGTFSWTAGTLTIAANGSSFGTTITVPNRGTLNVSSSLTDPVVVSGGGCLNLEPGPAGGITARRFGTITIATNNYSTTNGQFSVIANADHAYRQLLIAPSLVIAGSTNAWQGRLDLGNNDMDLSTGSLATISSLLSAGYSNGSWTGLAGITSTAAAADTSHLTALGVVQNGNAGGTLYSTGNLFDGTTPGSGDILVKYTYYGDANLDGTVDGSDYSLLDAGYAGNGALTGWFNGDFNYDGVIDGSDYALIDNAFNNQTASLVYSAEVTTSTAQVAPVPEPAGLLLLGLAALDIQGRHRSKSATVRSMLPAR